jgi:mono/diheme cytochrome c family protein
MKNIIVLILVISLFSCSKKDKPVTTSIFNTDNLPTQILSIDINKDTTVTTSNGAILFFPKGTLQSANANVKLELKEAYSMQQIILAGLSTTTNGKVLQSGGMFYLNPVGKDAVTIVQPIAMKLPTDKVNNSMQLYTGTEKDGKLNWEKPIPFKVKSPSNGIDARAMFINNCASCHAINKDATGPALGNMTKMRTKYYLREYTRNWESLVASGDCMAIKVAQSRPTAMNKFPMLKDDAIDAIFEYLESESTMPFNADGTKAGMDSCEKYKAKLEKLKALTVERRQWVAKNNPSVVYKEENKPDFKSNNTRAVPDTTPYTTEKIKDYVQPVETTGEYYELDITRFGWANLDDRPEFETVNLFVSMDKEWEEKVKLFLAIPNLRILQEAGKATNGLYAFSETNGNTELPIGREVILLAVGERDGKFYSGKTSFIVKDKQTIPIGIKESHISNFNDEMVLLGWNGLNIKATASKNQSQIKYIDTQIEQIKELKPSKYACDCLPSADTTVGFISSEELDQLKDTSSLNERTIVNAAEY